MLQPDPPPGPSLFAHVALVDQWGRSAMAKTCRAAAPSIARAARLSHAEYCHWMSGLRSRGSNRVAHLEKFWADSRCRGREAATAPPSRLSVNNTMTVPGNGSLTTSSAL